jgi:hypothetical protein
VTVSAELDVRIVEALRSPPLLTDIDAAQVEATPRTPFPVLPTFTTELPTTLRTGFAFGQDPVSSRGRYGWPPPGCPPLADVHARGTPINVNAYVSEPAVSVIAIEAAEMGAVPTQPELAPQLRLVQPMSYTCDPVR